MPRNERSQQSLFRGLAVTAARAADDKKGEDIVLFHTGAASSVADYTLLVGATSRNHISALEDNIKKTLREAGSSANHRDGRDSDRWRVLDYGGLIVHLMHPAAREFYALDHALGGSRKLRWQKTDPKAAGTKPAKKKPKPAEKKTARKNTARRKRG